MIIVVGSIYMDVNMPVKAFPQAGETIRGGNVMFACAGKGANQAAAAARAGAKTHLIGKIGEDDFGKKILDKLRGIGVLTPGVGKEKDIPTGTCVILVEPDGRNTIIASRGANNTVSSDQLPNEILKPGVTLVCGITFPDDALADMMTRAKSRGARVILNGAGKEVVSRFLPMCNIVVVNEDEFAFTADLYRVPPGDALSRAQALASAAGCDVVATLGGQGVVAARRDGQTYQFPSVPVEVVDTTGAGDCFLGTFAAALDSGLDWPDALQRGVAAGALACRARGGFEKFPFLNEIENNLSLYNSVHKTA